jgi:hypothetical protein
MPQPRQPRLPRLPHRPPLLPPLRLAPPRARGSVELDTASVSAGGLPPFVRFDMFMTQWKWEQGEHITTIGPTGSGKTVLNRVLLRRRDYVVVLGVKNRDDELYGPFQKDGYELVRSFNPEPPDEAERMRVLYVPRSDKRGAEGIQAKAKKFREALLDVEDTGYWCVYVDDVQFMADEMRLAPEFRVLWIMGRSEGISMVVSSQEPVDIPLQAYGQATHLFLFKNPDVYRARRMAELTGVNREIAQQTILRLPDHEFLYINKSNGRMLRSMVIR